MAISAKAFHDSTAVLDWLLCLLFGLCLLYLLLWLSAQLRHRFRPSREVRRAIPLTATGRLSVLGLITAIASPAAAHRRAPAAPSWRAADSPAPPWSATSGFPPPRPLVRIRALDERPAAPIHTSRAERAERAGGASGHAASNVDENRREASEGRADDLAPYLFSRGRRSYERQRGERSARDRAMAQHPAGKRRSDSCTSRHAQHVVVAGDTLWDIAALVLKTSDPARVARYWPLIHRANRDVIGPDPSLVFPGAVLDLPPECLR